MSKRRQKVSPYAGWTETDRKPCVKCGQVFALAAFKKSAQGFLARGRDCAECRRLDNLRRQYGDEGLLLDRRRLAGDPCEICGLRGTMVLDHCHRTGKLRGLLCSTCNVALGMAGDSLERLRQLAEYLERHRMD